jgi:pyridoxine/pyridoxamine 5'-phosphate oxidase
MADQPTITRRAALLGALTSTAALAVPAIAAVAPAEPAFDLQAWLDKVETQDVVQYHAMQLAAALCKQRPGLWRFGLNSIDTDGFVLFNRTSHPSNVSVVQDFH